MCPPAAVSSGAQGLLPGSRVCGRIQLTVVVALRSPFPHWLLARVTQPARENRSSFFPKHAKTFYFAIDCFKY